MVKTYTSSRPIAKTWAQMSGFVPMRYVFTPVKGGGMTYVSCGNRSLWCRFTQPPRKHEEITPAGEMDSEIRISGLCMKIFNGTLNMKTEIFSDKMCSICC